MLGVESFSVDRAGDVAAGVVDDRLWVRGPRRRRAHRRARSIGPVGRAPDTARLAILISASLNLVVLADTSSGRVITTQMTSRRDSGLDAFENVPAAFEPTPFSWAPRRPTHPRSHVSCRRRLRPFHRSEQRQRSSRQTRTRRPSTGHPSRAVTDRRARCAVLRQQRNGRTTSEAWSGSELPQAEPAPRRTRRVVTASVEVLSWRHDNT